MLKRFAVAAVILVLCEGAMAQLNLGSDGSDGNFVFVPDDGSGQTMTIDLRQAVSASWDTPSPNPGRGVYDAARWAVVFKYGTIIVPAGRTIVFRNHEPNAPVIWLATGVVEIRGTVNISGKTGASHAAPVSYADGGPGGFRGGRSSGLLGVNNSAGFGPGGAPMPAGQSYGTGGTYGTKGRVGNTANLSAAPTYGNQAIMPLIGGSGGSAGHSNVFQPCDGGGGGGGAILIGSNTTLTVFNNGSIVASGGVGGNGYWDGGSGSGGAIKLIGDVVVLQPVALLRATAPAPGNGGAGGLGRIRIEANTFDVSVNSEPPLTSASPPGGVFPSDNAPTVRLTSVDGQNTPADPMAGLLVNGIDLRLTNPNSVAVIIEGANVPVTPTPAIVYLRVVLATGNSMSVPATFASGDNTQSTWTAMTPFGQGVSAVQAMVDLP